MSGTNIDLERLLAPIETSRFFNEYWGQKPLYIPRAQPSYYAGLMSSRDVETFLCTYPLDRGPPRLLPNHAAPPAPANSLTSTDRQRKPGRGNAEPTDPIGMSDGYLQGKTVTLDSIQSRWGPVARLCRNLEEGFGQLAMASAFLTPPGAQSSMPHFDPDDVFILQLEGSKSWRVYPPAMPVPLPGYTYEIDPAHLGPPILEVEVQSGDLLYLPRGFIHYARASASASLHVTAGIDVCTWSHLLSEALTLAVRQNPELRQSVPIDLLQGDTPSAASQAQFQAMLQLFLEKADLTQAVARKVSDMLLDDLQPLPDGHFHQLPLASHIGLDTVMRKRDGSICRTVEGDDWAAIQFPGNTIRGPKAVGPALRLIARADQFAVRSLPELADEAKVILVRRLFQVGLLRIADSDSVPLRP